MHVSPSDIATAAPADGGAILQHAEIRRAAACRFFWSNHPLNLAYRAQHGEGTFSLKAFVQFVVDMSSDDFAACMFSAGVLR
jgi:hypothetical protein